MEQKEQVLTIIAKLLDEMNDERGGMLNRINVIDFVYRLNKKIMEELE